MRNLAPDITGQRFFRLLVIKRLPNDPQYNSVWLCLCDCGKEHVARGGNLRGGQTLSCGCWLREKGRSTVYRGALTHGHSIGYTNSPTYQCYHDMKKRCLQPNHFAYKYYGARGISICQRWLDSFSNFLEDMGEKPMGLTIERINNDGNYEKANCKWATRAEQNWNKRNTNYEAKACYLLSGTDLHNPDKRVGGGFGVESTNRVVGSKLVGTSSDNLVSKTDERAG